MKRVLGFGKYLLFITILLGCIHSLEAQQVADENYNPPIHSPAYNLGEGPVVFIDEGHHNFHTKNGRYKSFANLLERDGYKVLSYAGNFEKERLNDGKILVISNALHAKNVDDWFLPNPSAFTKSEIEILKNWVSDGGRLFLIADHMPMGGAAKDLAEAFEFKFTNGFAFDTINQGPSFFKLSDKSLHKNSITTGRNIEENVLQVATFTGQAMKLPKAAKPILTFGENFVNFLPDTAWVFNRNTKRYRVNGWSQGAYRTFGKGRIVVFGEAAMFSAQLAGPKKVKMGMNNQVAPQNYQLLLNVIHWLDGMLD